MTGLGCMFSSAALDRWSWAVGAIGGFTLPIAKNAEMVGIRIGMEVIVMVEDQPVRKAEDVASILRKSPKFKAVAVYGYNVEATAYGPGGDLTFLRCTTKGTDRDAQFMAEDMERSVTDSPSAHNPPLEGWRDIETAPDDGGEFIGYDEYAKKWGVCFKDHNGVIQLSGGDSGLIPPTFDEFGYDRTAITYWMRPPAAPR